jgi:SAM-dependent methyltransferase
MGPDMPVTYDAPTPQAAAWNAAADAYTDPALSFRDYFAVRILERLGLRPGVRLLDVCCGAGAVALPAAAAAGPRGRVVAMDFAEAMLRRGAGRAAAAGVRNIAWHVGELEALPFAPATFDAVVCAFGLHYAPDMRAATRALWQLVRPGGKLLVATWAGHLFEPADAAFWDAVRRVRPSLAVTSNPWDPIDTPAALAAMVASAGVPGGAVLQAPYSHLLLRPDDWWHIVLGTHYRAVVDALTPRERDLVEVLTLRPIQEDRIERIRADALFAVATR